MHQRPPGSDAGVEREILRRLQGIEAHLAQLANDLEVVRSSADPLTGEVTRFALTMTGQALRKEISEPEIRAALEGDLEILDPAFLACWAFYRRVRQTSESIE